MNVKLALAVCMGLPESFTVNVTVNVAETDGVPLITPVEVFSVTPLGNAPLVTAHVY